MCDKQVGVIGKMVEVSVYIVFGILGVVQYLQGIKDCCYVIVVNFDGSVLIVKCVNLMVVGDVQVMIVVLIEQVQVVWVVCGELLVVVGICEFEGVVV